MSLPPALMLLFGCHCISIFLPLEKRGLSGIRTRDVVMNDLGMVWGFDGYDAAPGSRVTALQRAMPAIKNQLCIYVSASMNFFFVFFCLRTSSGVDSVCRPNSNVDRTYCPVQLSARQAAG